MEFLPLFLKSGKRPVLIVGGGAVALRKLRMLRRADARIRIVAPQVVDALRLLAKHRTVTLIERNFKDEDIDNAFLVVAATDDTDLNRHISRLCRRRDILVNTVDSVSDSDFILPTTIERPPIQIAVTTGGSSPLLARSLASHLANCTPQAYGKLAALVGKYREPVKRAFSEAADRRRFWERVFRSRVAELIFAGHAAAAEHTLQTMIRKKNLTVPELGEVYLVGAGPGDPDLLTFKALRLMQQADVVFYDRLVSQPIMELLRVDAEKIYAGKERSKHAIAQQDINRMLVESARKGLRVLRLKGGDPFIFGRGGEEIETLLDENVPFQIVPGITAATGCAAYAGIPLTHRDYAQSCIFATGHLRNESVDLDWEVLVHPRQTLVFYMGLQGFHQICIKLIEHGLPETMPVALITRGTTPEQQVFSGNLSNIAALIEENDVKPPTLVIVGEVVKLRDKLRWYRSESDVQSTERNRTPPVVGFEDT